MAICRNGLARIRVVEQRDRWQSALEVVLDRPGLHPREEVPMDGDLAGGDRTITTNAIAPNMARSLQQLSI